MSLFMHMERLEDTVPKEGEVTTWTNQLVTAHWNAHKLLVRTEERQD